MSKVVFAILLALAVSTASFIQTTTPAYACGCNGGGNEKGNNGWGNGAEGTNNGSYQGGTAESKSTESGTQNNHDSR